jgi:Cu(I)/Ag(I) efflux system protein CusF
MDMKWTVLLAVTALLLNPALADDSHHAKPGASAAALADGEVRRVDKDAQKLTIRHGPMPELDMPQPMTMVYRVKDEAMLDRVKAGDRIRFQAEKIDGAFVVTKIEPQK